MARPLPYTEASDAARLRAGSKSAPAGKPPSRRTTQASRKWIENMACPYLKEVVMLFCDAYPVKKMLPLDRIVSANPCLGEFHGCPLFPDILARVPPPGAPRAPPSAH